MTGVLCSVAALVVFGADNFILPAMVLILLALFLMRLGFAAETREQAARRNRYGRIDRRHARTEEPEYRQNRRDA